MNKKSIVKLTQESENIVYTSLEDVEYLIQLHAELGYYEMETFIEKDIANKIQQSLDKKGFYCRIINFKALPNEVRIYVSWISSL
jgi:hypothetical protein